MTLQILTSSIDERILYSCLLGSQGVIAFDHNVTNGVRLVRMANVPEIKKVSERGYEVHLQICAC